MQEGELRWDSFLQPTTCDPRPLKCLGNCRLHANVQDQTARDASAKVSNIRTSGAIGVGCNMEGPHAAEVAVGPQNIPWARAGSVKNNAGRGNMEKPFACSGITRSESS